MTALARLAACACACGAAPAAHAQAVAASAPAAAAEPAQGAVSYPAAYFAAQHPASALDMVGLLPGFALDTGAAVRGFEGAAGNVLIDGRRPAAKTDSLSEILRRLPASQIERIDVIHGGAPGIDMQGKSVIANVVRSQRAGLSGSFSLSDGQEYGGRNGMGGRAVLARAIGSSKLELGLSFGRSADNTVGAGPDVQQQPAGRPPLRTFVDARAAMLWGQGTAAYETGVFGGRLRLNGRLYQDKYKFSELDSGEPPAAADAAREADRTHETEIGGQFDRDLTGKDSLGLLALSHGKTVTTDSGSALHSSVELFQLRRRSVENLARVQLKHQARSDLSFEAGAEGALNTLEGHSRFSVSGHDVELPAATVKVEEDRAEAFGKAVWRPTAQWTFDAGLRYEGSRISASGDVNVDKTLYFAKPRLVAIWAPTEGAQVRLRAERQVGQLDFTQFVAATSLNGAGLTAGNPDLNPEQAWLLEGALEVQFWSGGDVALSLRHFDIADAIDRGPIFANGRVFDRPANIGRGSKDELALDLTVPLDKVGITGGQLKGGLTRRYSSVTDPTTHSKREISGLHPLDWNLSFRHAIAPWRLTWGATASGEWRETYYRFNAIQIDKNKTYVTPFVEWSPTDAWKLRVDLPNITDRGLTHDLATYPGVRKPGEVPLIDSRHVHSRRFIVVQLTHNLGG